MVRKVAAIVLLVLVVGGIFGYIALGGLQQPEISESASPGYIIAGMAYKGNASDEKLADIFSQVKQYNEQGALAGTLTAVYFDTLGADKGLVNCFIGVLTTDTSATLPAGFFLQHIPVDQVVQAHVQAHFLVAPSPAKVQARLKEYAGNKGLLLDSFLIEKYLDERNFILEIPVKTKQSE